MVKNWNYYTLLVGMQNGVVSIEYSRRFLKKLKIKLSRDLEISFVYMYPKKKKN